LHVHGHSAKTDACGRSFAVLSAQVSTAALRQRHVLGHSAKTDGCGLSFAVLSTQVSKAGLRVRHNRLTCGSMLEVSRDAVAGGEEKFVSCAAYQNKYCFICTVIFDFYGDLPSTSCCRWQCLRGGADAGLNSCYAACCCGAEYRCEALPGKNVWLHAHRPFAAQRGDSAPSPRSPMVPMVNKKNHSTQAS
jgi:hypothetical protein